MAVLNRQEIAKAIKSGALVFDPPLEVMQFGPSSVDLRLGNTFTKYQVPNVGGVDPAVTLAGVTGVKGAEDVVDLYGVTTVVEDGGTYRLYPGDFVLGYTKERIAMPKDMIARVEGRSSFARLGIAIHQTAPTVHAGWEGHLRLEIKNNGPITCILSEGLLFCQLIIEGLGGVGFTPNPPIDG